MIDILLEASLRSLVVGVCASVVLHALGVRSGATRHAALTSVLLAMLVSPLIVVWRPALPVTLPNVTLPVAISAVRSPPVVVASRTAASTETAASAFVASSRGPEARASLSSAEAALPVGVTGSWSWSEVALIIWAAGVLAGALHLAIGWHRLCRFASSCVLVESAEIRHVTTATVAESPAAVTPVVYGILRPRIVLPSSWSTWPAADLHATLAHEAAHIRRRDTLIALVARVNRSVFWFHPLAWWLERALASSAEQACDDEVVRERGDERAYAELLVRSASAVSIARGRVAWPAIGIGGRGSLETRIDRLLSGDGRGPMPRRRAVVLAIGCAVVITVGMACQQQPAPLRPDPEREAAWQLRDESMREWQAATSMTLQQVEEMEASATANPTNLETTIALLTFYQHRGQAEFGWNAMLERRRPHFLRLIQHHPEAGVAARRIIQAHDPEGYAQARALWMAHVSSPDASTAVLANAASFFSVSEKPLAEELLLRAQALDADGPQPRLENGVYSPSWEQRLGELYALAILGSNDALEGNVVRSVDPAAARGPFATRARATLVETSNAAILVSAGRVLTRNARREGLAQSLGFDIETMGRTLLARALTLDPALDEPRMIWLQEDSRRRHERVTEFFRQAATDPEAAMAALPETQRLGLYADVTAYTYLGAGGALWLGQGQNDEPGRARARRVAEAALQLADRHRTHPEYGTVIHRAHIALGTLAIREGDRPTALSHLRAAAASPGSNELTWMPWMEHLALVHPLLDAGEYEAVASYLDRLAELNRVGATRWRDEARAIREGRMPESYQRAKRSAVVVAAGRF
jgi:beta-lactamase regulating signal transducer with metallopeptidase domain